MSNIKKFDDNFYDDDEIDLFELFQKIWRKKIIVIFTMFLFGLIAALYVFNSQQWWTSNAIITNGYYKYTEELKSKIIDLYVLADNSKTNENLNKLFDNENILESYVKEFNAYDNKKEFIETNPIFIKYKKEDNVQNDFNNDLFIDKWARRISATLVNKKEKNIYNLKFKATTASLSHNLLDAYSEFINQKVKKELVSHLESIVSYNLSYFGAKKLELEAQAKNDLEVELMKTIYSLKIASAADVKQPIPEMGNGKVFSIDLGSKALTEQLNVLKNIKDLSFFDKKIEMIEFKLNSLSKIKTIKAGDFKSVRYLQAISYPIKRDGVSRVLIILFSMIVGLGFSVAFIFSSDKFTRKF